MKKELINKNKSRFLYTLVIALSSFGFFKPIFAGISNAGYGLIFGVLLIPALLSLILFINRRKSFPLAFAEKLIIFSIIASTVCAKFIWGQSLWQSMIVTIPAVCGYIFYFYLNVHNIPFRTIEKVIGILGVLFVCFFLISFLIYPLRIFNYLETSERGFQRIFLAGDGFLFLFYFFSLNKLVVTKKKWWLLCIILAFICILLNQTRIYILATTLIGLFYLLNRSHILLKIGLVLFFIASFFYLPNLTFFKNVQSLTTDQLNEIDDYVRINAADYFLHEFQPSSITVVFGNGFAYDKSTYGQKISDLIDYNGYYIEDLGFVGLYIHLGILAIIAYIIIFYKVFTREILPEFLYVKMFLAFLIMTGLTSSNTFNAGFIIPIVFSFYLVDNFSSSRNGFSSAIG